jgi:hypothetical protein
MQACQLAESIVKEVARKIEVYMAVKGLVPSELVLRFILHLLYSAQTLCAESTRRTGDDSAYQSVELLRRMVKVMDQRWKAAGKLS